MHGGTPPTEAGWFAGVDPDDLDAAREAITDGETDEPDDWSALAVEAGYVDSTDEYYEWLHAATVHAAAEDVRERERADDQQLKHAIRAMDDAARTANELAERVEEWGGALFDDDLGGGVAAARDVAARDPRDPTEERVVSLAARVVALDDERDALRAYVETHAPTVAPNLAEMAGPVLAARLVALAGGLEPLAKMPAGTIQVLGAEDALFAHLRGRAPSPKHGVIFTHEFVRGTRPEDRGSAARAFAAKLALAARADHYAGERRERLHVDLAARMERIRSRAHPGGTGGEDA
ncbi:NOP5/NOP56 family protein [Salinigranum salinum]|uniref:NOP5/NOP56 family protein n=1 Tax=Salinigranum salinum TaxID=1364937 RepID=UPI0012612202|nr:NOP5/NOP56 family protein [Salinigranum salinum]